MAKDGKPLDDRDAAVLSAFARENPTPRASDVDRWAGEHPHLREELLALAIDLHRMGSMRDREPSREELDESWRRHRARAAEIAAAAGRAPRLADLAARGGTDLGDVADAIRCDPRILDGLDAGRIGPTVTRRLVEALTTALRCSAGEVRDALNASFVAPKAAFPKSDGAPKIARVRYEDAVAASGMSEERKAHWLGED